MGIPPPITREEAYLALSSLNPAQIFLESYQTKPIAENLDIFFGPPEEFFIAPDTQQRYSRGQLIPILDDGKFGVVTFLAPETQELVQIHVESPDQEWARFSTWQQFLANLMARIAEEIDEDDRLPRIAELIGLNEPLTGGH